MPKSIQFYSQFPPRDFREREFGEHIPLLKQVESRFDGSLVYFDHSTLDPWVTVASIIHHTDRHIPLVAVQPYTMQPATAASMIYTFAHIYNRKVDVNLISGALPKDLEEVGDSLSKPERYERLREFGEIVRGLLSSNEPFDYRGKYYTYQQFSSKLALPRELMPNFFVPMLSGSPESIACIEAVADTVVTLPNGLQSVTDLFSRLKGKQLELCVKVQLLARPEARAALSALKQDAKYYERRLAKSKYLQEHSMEEEERQVFYPTVDFVGPMIVGSYEQVSSYLRRYIEAGITKFIVPNVLSEEDLHHCTQVLDLLDQKLLVI
ncbi:LLM class flavin-dependent oxidoreductase [Paenibacillus xylaniclasticus]|uniref:LLM class flavin-dependent oxidoreductase n=1 Tax=Paenibacillus xylaniclasticus TaxID=588083 RepID=UPI000FDC77F4|nr:MULTISPECIES: LLM class flavin-dependent oxidoreductase [Paenibacillus]GFN32213.1 hypothetical protein PCURB6_24730 [Paenibacillus curdlanolyticus]